MSDSNLPPAVRSELISALVVRLRNNLLSAEDFNAEFRRLSTHERIALLERLDAVNAAAERDARNSCNLR